MYQPGDYVYPTDLPRRLLCRVTQAESLNPPGEGFQILKLTPLEGPWKAATQLVRFADDVCPAHVRPSGRAPYPCRDSTSVRPGARYAHRVPRSRPVPPHRVALRDAVLARMGSGWGPDGLPRPDPIA